MRRSQLGLSQAQLAGKDLTRAFISQVENGRCTPSPQTLKLLADRLQKPLSFFLEEGQADQVGLRFLWKSAREDAAAKRWMEAKEKLGEALQLANRGEVGDLSAEIQLLYGEALFRCNEYDTALDHLEEALEQFGARGKGVETSRIWLLMGNCYWGLEQFSSASRYYKKVIRYTTGLKSGQDLHALAYCYLGTINGIKGNLQEACTCYQTTIRTVLPGDTSGLWGRTAAGLSGIYTRMGKLDLAYEWAKKAHEALKKLKSPEAAGAEHNMAVALMQMGKLEQGYALLQRTYSYYLERGDAVSQARVMEDLVSYWQAKQNYVRAEELAWQALELLRGTATKKLRGLLYFRLGQIARARGAIERTREFLHISCELLSEAGAQDKVAEVLEILVGLTAEAGDHGAYV